MAADPDFDSIDAKIEALQERIDGCRQSMALSRAAIVVSAVALASMAFSAGLRTPPIAFSAIAGLIGGAVWLGASGASRNEMEAELAALDLTKNRMIDAVALRNGWRDMTSTVH